MRKKLKHPINYLAVLLAMLSFVIGTVLLVSYKMTGEFGLLVIGYYHVLGAAIVNAIMLLLLLINASVHSKDYKENLLTILILTLNIPITALYLELL